MYLCNLKEMRRVPAKQSDPAFQSELFWLLGLGANQLKGDAVSFKVTWCETWGIGQPVRSLLWMIWIWVNSFLDWSHLRYYSFILWFEHSLKVFCLFCFVVCLFVFKWDWMFFWRPLFVTLSSLDVGKKDGV